MSTSHEQDNSKSMDLNDEECLVLLKTLLAAAIEGELETILNEPTLAKVHELPFLRVSFSIFVRDFPWIKNENREFWGYVEKVMSKFAALKLSTTKSRGVDDEGVMIERFKRLLVIVFKNMMRQEGQEMPSLDEISEDFGEDPCTPLQDCPISLSPVVRLVGQRNEKPLIGKGYTSYVIQTTFNDLSVYSVHRYSDFIPLHDQLVKHFPTHSIPPLPGKKILSDRFDEQFLMQRRRDLTAYLQKLLRLGDDVVASPEVQQFLFTKNLTELTPKEQEIVAREKQEEMMLANAADAAYQRLLGLVNEFFTADQAEEGLEKLYPTLKSYDKLSEIPPPFQEMIVLSRQLLAYRFYWDFHGDVFADEKFSMTKKMYHLIPFSGIRACIWATNPLKIIRSFVDLFFAKAPLKEQNLAQILMKESFSSRPEMSDDVLMGIRESIHNPKICDKICNYVRHRDLPLPVLITGKSHSILYNIVSCPLVEPLFEDPFQILGSLSQKETNLCMNLVRIEMQRFDAEETMSFLGDEEVISCFKEIIGAFYEPLMQLYQSADIDAAVSVLKEGWKGIIAVGNEYRYHRKPADIMQAYLSFIRESEEKAYTLLHSLTAKDNGLMENLLRWVLDVSSFVRKDRFQKQLSIDMRSLVDKSIGGDQKKEFQLELQQLVYTTRRERLKRSNQMKMLLSKRDHFQFDLGAYISDDDVNEIQLSDPLSVPGDMGKASKEGLHSKRSVAARKSLSCSEMSSLNSAGDEIRRREIVEELLPLFVRMANEDVFCHIDCQSPLEKHSCDGSHLQ